MGLLKKRIMIVILLMLIAMGYSHLGSIEKVTFKFNELILAFSCQQEKGTVMLCGLFEQRVWLVCFSILRTFFPSISIAKEREKRVSYNFQSFYKLLFQYLVGLTIRRTSPHLRQYGSQQPEKLAPAFPEAI